MYTYLPFPDFADSAGVLNDKDLGMTEIWTRRIVMGLSGDTPTTGSRTEQAWRGHAKGLCVYGLYISAEMGMRGRKSNYQPFFEERRRDFAGEQRETTLFPGWTFSAEVHEAFQALLLWQDPEYYCNKFETYASDERPEFPWNLLS